MDLNETIKIIGLIVVTFIILFSYDQINTPRNFVNPVHAKT